MGVCVWYDIHGCLHVGVVCSVVCGWGVHVCVDLTSTLHFKFYGRLELLISLFMYFNVEIY